jgi:hypothetical protein
LIAFPVLIRSSAMPATGNPTVAMVEAAYRHHGIQAPLHQLRAVAGLLGDAARAGDGMDRAQPLDPRQTALSNPMLAALWP